MVILDTLQHVPNRGRERLQHGKLLLELICRSIKNSQIDVDLMQQLRKKTGLFEAPWLRAAAKNQQVWLEDPSLYILVFVTIEFQKCT